MARPRQDTDPTPPDTTGQDQPFDVDALFKAGSSPADQPFDVDALFATPLPRGMSTEDGSYPAERKPVSRLGYMAPPVVASRVARAKRPVSNRQVSPEAARETLVVNPLAAGTDPGWEPIKRDFAALDKSLRYDAAPAIRRAGQAIGSAARGVSSFLDTDIEPALEADISGRFAFKPIPANERISPSVAGFDRAVGNLGKGAAAAKRFLDRDLLEPKTTLPNVLAPDDQQFTTEAIARPGRRMPTPAAPDMAPRDALPGKYTPPAATPDEPLPGEVGYRDPMGVAEARAQAQRIADGRAKNNPQTGRAYTPEERKLAAFVDHNLRFRQEREESKDGFGRRALNSAASGLVNTEANLDLRAARATGDLVTASDLDALGISTDKGRLRTDPTLGETVTEEMLPAAAGQLPYFLVPAEGLAIRSALGLGAAKAGEEVTRTGIAGALELAARGAAPTAKTVLGRAGQRMVAGGLPGVGAGAGLAYTQATVEGATPAEAGRDAAVAGVSNFLLGGMIHATAGAAGDVVGGPIKKLLGKAGTAYRGHLTSLQREAERFHLSNDTPADIPVKPPTPTPDDVQAGQEVAATIAESDAAREAQGKLPTSDKTADGQAQDVAEPVLQKTKRRKIAQAVKSAIAPDEIDKRAAFYGRTREEEIAAEQAVDDHLAAEPLQYSRGENMAKFAAEENANLSPEEVAAKKVAAYKERYGHEPGERAASVDVAAQQAAASAEPAPEGSTDLFGNPIAPKIEQGGLFGEGAGTQAAREDAARLANKDQPISADEMAARRDELGAKRSRVATGEDQTEIPTRENWKPTPKAEWPGAGDAVVSSGGMKGTVVRVKETGSVPYARVKWENGHEGTITITQVRKLAADLKAKPETIPIRDKRGALARDLSKVGDDDLHNELARLAEANATEEGLHAAVENAGYRANYEELPRTEKLGRKGQEDLPDADGQVDAERLAEDNKTVRQYRKNQVVRQARERAIKRIEGELARRAGDAGDAAAVERAAIQAEPAGDATDFDFGPPPDETPAPTPRAPEPPAPVTPEQAVASGTAKKGADAAQADIDLNREMIGRIEDPAALAARLGESDQYPHTVRDQVAAIAQAMRNQNGDSRSVPALIVKIGNAIKDLPGGQRVAEKLTEAGVDLVNGAKPRSAEADLPMGAEPPAAPKPRDVSKARHANRLMQALKDKGDIPQGGPSATELTRGSAFANPIGPALKLLAANPRLAKSTVMAAVGMELNALDQEKHPYLQETGLPLIGLALLSGIGSENLGKGADALGHSAVESLRKTDAGKRIVNFLNPDALLDPGVLAWIREYERMVTRGQARAVEFSGKAGRLTPEQNRAVSDLIEGESWGDVPKLTPQQLLDAQTVAAQLTTEFMDLGQRLVNSGVLSQEAFASHQGKYLPRRYAEWDALRVMGDRQKPPLGAGKSTRVGPQQPRTIDMPYKNAARKIEQAKWELDPANKNNVSKRLADAEAEYKRLSNAKRRAGDDFKKRDKLAVQQKAARDIRQQLRREKRQHETRIANGPARLASLEKRALINREKLGEIREASYRTAYGIEKGYRDLGAMQLFGLLRTKPGTIHPEYLQALDDFLKVRQDFYAGNATQQELDAAKGVMTRVADRYKTTEGKGDYVMLPDTKGLGVLRGMLVKREVANSINGLPDLRYTKPILHWWKKAKTVFNPGTHVANWVSNMNMAHVAGLPMWEQPKYWHQTFEAMKAYGTGGDPKVAEPVRIMAEAGMLNVNAVTANSEGTTAGQALTRDNLSKLKATTREATRRVLDYRNVPDPSASRTMAFVKKLDEKASRIYNNGDNVFRVALFMKGRDLGMGDAQAIKFATDAMGDFRTRSPALNMVRGTVAPFILYAAKAMPAFTKNIVDHPERYLTLAAVWAGINEASRATQGAIPQRDLAERDRVGRMGYLLPGFTQLPFKDEHGNKAGTDVSRWLPVSGLTTGAPPGTVGGQLSDDYPAILGASGPLPDVIGKFWLNVDPFTGKPNITKAHRWQQNVGTLLGQAASEALPSALGFHAGRLAEDYQNRDWHAAGIDALGPLGLRPRYIRPGAQVQQSTFEYEDQKRTIARELSLALRKNKNPERARALVQDYIANRRHIEEEYLRRLDIKPKGR